ncbi:PDF receptor-like isoform X2 [Mytilus trossulus]|uniref:PDF receptor-like isoform X2 n=1 Tax=Mytilus trossulus TaxID=6551 RepID=UPI0030064068
MNQSTVFGNFTYPFLDGNGNATDSIMKEPWNYRSESECLTGLADNLYGKDDGKMYCNGTWDKVLCWPSVAAETTVFLPCPPLPGLDPTKEAFRKCGPGGRWENKNPGDYSLPKGYTNYTVCYTPEAYEVYLKFMAGKTAAERQSMKHIAAGTRTMEIVGLSISLVVSLISVFIFTYFRSLRCHRTRIHRNLFVSIIAQTIIRLVLYLDQYAARLKGGEVGGAAGSNSQTIFDTPVFCEALYALLEYTKTVQFMWMLIEGLFLHNMIAVSVFSGKPNYLIFYLLGWGSPIPVTVAWVITMVHKHQVKCWFSYTFTPFYWIIETPRVAVIAVNLMFLLNIIRVLITKLQKSQTNEPHVTKVRKAVKAAIILLPLLGITNFVVMTDPPSGVTAFGIWSFTTYFLVSFQGFFISLLYCFLNGEVQDTIRRHLCFKRPTRWDASHTSIRIYMYPPPKKQSQRRPSAIPPPTGNAVPLLREIVARSDSRL